MTITDKVGFTRKLADQAAEAWRALLLAEPEEVPDICEGCWKPAYRSDDEGVKLCDDCYAECLTEVPA